MYQDLAEAIEDIQQKGYTHLFEVHDNALRCKETEEEYPSAKLRIVSTYKFDRGTDPGDDSSLYLIETDSGVKGYIVGGATMYRDREKAEFLDQLLQKK
ncbi:hypothetical protein NC796_13030 [Aliifodinibius sp. S!AR15-10]|uniref:hypothetical protein n=1 Tax=Aliifodinibius sp. S!AR15-10 TaxID=2950437 RepID=UPI0028658C92|nr:hypothetical protein [Aliifodinibius sp. S!AR15-10]MDR8392072.1 hypothetical protein [Aliifodinibius sp. S!AR15-10]